jgi:hypothetical protein
VKYTPDQQRQLIPNEAVRCSFLRRPDVASLPPDEQERRWQSHLVKVNAFRETLSRLDCIGVIQ